MQEFARLASFITWPQEAEILSLTLARHGFYYSGTGDKVICSGCSVPLDHWKRNENPEEKHRRFSPRCKFVNDGSANEMLIKHISMPIRGSTTTDGSSSMVPGRHPGTLDEVYASVMSRANKNGLVVNNLENTTLNRPAIDYDKLRRSEDFRYSTFRNWPQDSNPDPRTLAREGLFYSDTENEVRCAFCKGIVGKLDPIIAHRKQYPQCPFVLGHDVGSIPNPSDTTIDCGPQEVRTTDTSPRLVVESEKIEALASNLDSMVSPKFPLFSRLSERIDSFSRGVIPQGQTVKNLAEAGWFFVGPGDKVRCFQCGGNLRDWEPDDDPWTEHRRWYQDCAHLKTQKLTMTSRNQTSDAVQFRIEPREVKARMDTTTVRAILNLGYSNSLVRQVIENQLITTGDDFPNSEALLEAIFAVDDPIPSPPNSTSTSNAVSTDHSTTLATSTVTNSHVTVDGNNRPSPKSSSHTLTSSSTVIGSTQSSSPRSVTSVMSSHSINSAINSLSPDPKSTQTRPDASSTVRPLNQKISDEQSKSNGKPKKNKKKNASKAISTTEEQEQRTDTIPGEHREEKVNNTEAIDDDEALQENRRLREARSCKVCMDAEVNTVFLPCGHLVCCAACAPHLKDCPICRTFIRGTVKTFLS